jgi:hypothetical protein
MTLSVDFNSFSKTPFAWAAQPHVLGAGGQAVVIEDRGTAVKIFLRSDNFGDNNVKTALERELAVLSWLHTHNDTDIATPKPLEAKWLHQPHRFGLRADGVERSETLHALGFIRMSQLKGETPPAPNLVDSIVEPAAKAGMRELGRAMAQFNQLGAGLMTQLQLEINDPVVCRFRQLISHEAAAPYFTRADVAMLADDYVALTKSAEFTGLAHGDLHLRQLLWSPATQRATGMVDWGEAVCALPGRDFMHYGLIPNHPVKQQAAETIMLGYTHAGGREPDPLVMRLYALMRRAYTIADCPSEIKG